MKITPYATIINRGACLILTMFFVLLGFQDVTAQLDDCSFNAGGQNCPIAIPIHCDEEERVRGKCDPRTEDKDVSYYLENFRLQLITTTVIIFIAGAVLYKKHKK